MHAYFGSLNQKREMQCGKAKKNIDLIINDAVHQIKRNEFKLID
jgi:hypothetical protein